VLKVLQTVSIVDSDPCVRARLTSLVRDAGWHAESFASREAFLARPELPGAGCLVVDIALLDLDDMGTILRPELDHLRLPVIFLADSADAPTIVRAMKGGAVEFLTKPCNEGALLRALHQAITRSTDTLTRAAEVRVLRERFALLSQRERQVMMLVVGGRLNKQVGAALGISEITVKAHRGRVMRKMRADSLAGLVTMAARLQFGTDDFRPSATFSQHQDPMSQATSWANAFGDPVGFSSALG
jgi:FixJ family two-component response regulator